MSESRSVPLSPLTPRSQRCIRGPYLKVASTTRAQSRLLEHDLKRTILAATAVVVIAALAYGWEAVGAGGPALPLRALADVPLSGEATRFDYASFDVGPSSLWLAHMGDGAIEQVDLTANKLTRTIALGAGSSVRGILVANGRVYASAQGLRSVVVLDATSGTILASIEAGDVDGLDYDPITKRVFVSDESGNRVVAIDTRTNRAIGSVDLAGEAGNTRVDRVSGHVFVGVQTRNELAEIDPRTLRILRRFPLAGCLSSHSVAIDAPARAAYIGCQMNARIVRLDLRTGAVTHTGGVGVGVDVLALDETRHRLYVASESGVVSVYDVDTGGLTRIAQAFLVLHAHVVAVDPRTHRVYFPLQDVGGKPVLRVMSAR